MHFKTLLQYYIRSDKYNNRDKMWQKDGEFVEDVLLHCQMVNLWRGCFTSMLRQSAIAPKTSGAFELSTLLSFLKAVKKCSYSREYNKCQNLFANASALYIQHKI